MKHRLTLPTLIVAVLALGLTAATCHHQEARDTAASGSVSIATALFAVQDAELALVSTGALTADQHAAFNAKFRPALQAGRTYNAAVRAWVPGKPIPIEVKQAGDALNAAAAFLTSILPESSAGAVMSAISKAQAIIIATLVALGA